MTHYYAVDNSGMATLCADLQDAIDSAAEYTELYPKRAPYTVATMVAVDAALTEQEQS